ncbi:response regulator [Desulfotignum phosphitoxidans]|uniref:Response regulator receiver domain-containing protein n=1 Tax=Desulfotignum phosphitoxidans DSM 13687 TaxID=1286635 RepID=S0G7A6_9BACT|nr:response regulator [Desulfotignum phosphitoxidans]EMS80696.1 response regulator receiver domain-containing protein [Desulfotignum phosphitoxidans DSM 13687]
MFKTTSKIMLVDDEKDFVEMLSLRLKENEENVIAAYNGQECLDTLEKIQVDVIILDVKMPGMDGIETLKQIKKRHPLVEVILLTGHGTIQSAVEGMKLGAFDFLLKPADFKELTEKLTKAKERRKEQMERIQKAEAAILLRQSKI